MTTCNLKGHDMSNEKKCIDCVFWKNNLAYEPMGNCRRFPPIHSDVLMKIGLKEAADVDDEQAAIAMDGWLWPLTAFDHWCGEFKPLTGEQD